VKWPDFDRRRLVGDEKMPIGSHRRLVGLQDQPIDVTDDSSLS
jgi:hypothetical protein